MTREKIWQDIIGVEELEKDWVTPVQMGKRRLAVYDTSTGIFVTVAVCSHGGADLCDGYFDGHVIECPLHQGAFDVRSGKPIGAPATRNIKTFEARKMDGKVQILA